MPAQQFQEEPKRQGSEEDFADRVRGAIQRKLNGPRPMIDDIAEALDLSSRIFERRLPDTGSSFRLVAEEAHHQLARRYLNNSVLELNEAAYLLLDMKIPTPSFARSAGSKAQAKSLKKITRPVSLSCTFAGRRPWATRGKEFRLPAGEKSSLPGPCHKSAPLVERRTDAETQTWKEQSGSVGRWARLHGHELWLRSGRR